jgi:CelD/BcsL family acetyltransferase involved in cellulose biosynthesis
MKIERIETITAFAELRDEWNALLSRSASDCVFLTHEWLFTWWKHLADDRRLSILAARSEDRLVGVLPLANRPPQYSRMIPRVYEFLGSGVIGSDYLDVIVSPGHERDVLRLFGECLSREGLALQLTQLRRNASTSAAFAAHLSANEWLARECGVNVCPFIDLRGHSWESYLATLGSSQRYNFNRRLRHLMKNGGFRLECVRSREDAPRALEILIALHRKRWIPAKESEAFHTDAIVSFHREFVESAAERGWLRLLIMWLGDVPVAALYGLHYGATFYFYQSGFDPDYSKQSVGLVMMGLAIKSAIEEGAGEYDFLHGSEEYKFHWAPQTRELGRIELYPPDVRGHLFNTAVEFNRAARRMARRVLKKV